MRREAWGGVARVMTRKSIESIESIESLDMVIRAAHSLAPRSTSNPMASTRDYLSPNDVLSRSR